MDNAILHLMINLYDILKAANGQLFGQPAANLFTDFSLDPQDVGEGKLFVALRSSTGDSHQYIPEAISNGASGVLCVDPPETDVSGVSVLMVRDTVDALLKWAKLTIKKLNVKVIAVAGSTGKSATVDAITHVLEKRYEVHRGATDVDGMLNVPFSLASLTANHDFVVLKLDVAAPNEMSEIVEAISPTVAVVNHIDCYHPAAFDSCKQYTSEQGLVIEALEPESLAVINYDDDATRELASRAKQGVTVKTIGIDRFGADALAFNVKVGIERIGFDLRYAGDRYVARWSPLLGKHQLYDILSSLMVATHFGILMEDALKSLTELHPLPGRMSLIDGRDNIILVDDSYRASHASTIAALDWLKDVHDEEQRTIFVVGDMDNLGENNRIAHRSVGRHAAEIADVIITQGVDGALIARAAIDHGKDPSNVFMTYSTKDAILQLERLKLDYTDIVLVKGGTNARMEAIVEALLPPEALTDEIIVHRQTTQISSQHYDLRPSWLEIDSSILANNISIIRQNLPDDVALMAVVKADAYGHGAVMAARTAVFNGADYLAVASMAEALELRDAGIEAPILVLSYTPSEAVPQALRHNITVTIFDLEQAKQYDRASRGVEGKLKYHVKIDTGMGRLGLFPDEAIHTFRHLNTLQNLDLEGIYTHFSSAESDPEYTAEQVDVFKMVVRPLRASGFQFKYIHASNSPGMLGDKENLFNLVRPGLILYGLTPSPVQKLYDGIKPLLTWKTTVLQVKTFPSNSSIGYGRTYITTGEERIAILPIGYADGFRRSPQTWQHVLINGKLAPVVGRISMEKCAVNVTDIQGVAAGDEVVLLGKQGDAEITAEMAGTWLGTINYEVTTTILPRVPRG